MQQDLRGALTYTTSNNSINTVLIYFSVYRLVVQFQFDQATDLNQRGEAWEGVYAYKVAT